MIHCDIPWRKIDKEDMEFFFFFFSLKFFLLKPFLFSALACCRFLILVCVLALRHRE